MKPFYNEKKNSLFFLVVVFFMALSDRGVQKIDTAILDNSSFIKLEKGEPRLDAIIIADGGSCAVQDIAFFGKAAIDKVFSELDDSLRLVEFSKIKEINVIKQLYQTKVFRNKDFVLVNVLSNTGYLTENLLIPRDSVICAIDKKTGLEKVWYFSTINKIIFNLQVDNNLSKNNTRNWFFDYFFKKLKNTEIVSSEQKVKKTTVFHTDVKSPSSNKKIKSVDSFVKKNIVPNDKIIVDKEQQEGVIFFVLKNVLIVFLILIFFLV